MNPVTSPHRRAAAIGAALASLLLLAGCAGGPGAAGDSTPADQASSNVVPGYALGEIPPIPDIELPSLDLMLSFDSDLSAGLTSAVGSYPGVSIVPAQCDASGAYAGTNVSGGGAVSSTTDAGQSYNAGDGSGFIQRDGWSYFNFGDGGASLTGPNGLEYQNFGDGSGSYDDGTQHISVYGGGSGQITRGDESIYNAGDGSGSWDRGAVAIRNNGDGTGSYTDGSLEIENKGDGTALVNGESVPADPIAPLAQVADVPRMSSLAPATPCGLTVTLENEALFDFGSAEVRPDSQAALASLAQAMKDLGVPKAEVSGHTDSVGDDAENQTLSEQRAQAVVAALQGAGVTSQLTATGYGETRPVAANENPDGSDNEAGRQQNRRVEVFIPTFTQQ